MAASGLAVARNADGDTQWRVEAVRAFAWFMDENGLSTPLVDRETAPAAMVSTAIGRVRTAAVNPWYPIFSASPRFASSPA
jgi:hypothetical protein